MAQSIGFYTLSKAYGTVNVVKEDVCGVRSCVLVCSIRGRMDSSTQSICRAHTEREFDWIGCT